MTYYLSGALASQNSASIDQAITGGLPTSVTDYNSSIKENLAFDLSPSGEYMLKTTFMGTGSFGSDPGNDYDPGMIIYQSASATGYTQAGFIKIKGSRANDSAYFYTDANNLMSPRFLSDDTIVIACDYYDPQDGGSVIPDGAFIVVTGSGTSWGISQIFSGSTSHAVASTAQSRDANLGGPSVIGDFAGTDDHAKMVTANNKYSSTLATRVAVHNYGGHSSSGRPQGVVTIFQQSGGTWSFHSQFSQEDIDDYISGNFSSAMSVHDLTWIDENNLVVVYFADGSTDYSFMIAMSWNASTSKWEVSGYDGSQMSNYAYRLTTRLSIDASTSGVQGIRFVEYDPFSERLLMGYQGDSIWMFQSASNWLRDDLYGNSLGKGNTSEEEDHGHTGALGFPPFGHKQHMRFAFAAGRTTVVGVQSRWGSEASATNSAFNSLVYHESSSVNGGWMGYDISYNTNVYQGRMKQEYFTLNNGISLAAEPTTGFGISPWIHSRQAYEYYGAKTAFTMNSTNGGDGNTFVYHEAAELNGVSTQKDTQRLLVGNFGAFPASNPSLADSVTGTVGSSGGTVSAGGTVATPDVTLTIPAGALLGDTAITADVSGDNDVLRNGLSLALNKAKAASKLIRLTPHGTMFNSAVTIQFDLTDSTAGTKIYKRNGPSGTWYGVPENLFNRSGNTITIKTTTFSDYQAVTGDTNMARTLINNKQLAKLTQQNKVLGTSLDITGSGAPRASVLATDMFLLQPSASGVPVQVSASVMRSFFSDVSVEVTDKSVAHRVIFAEHTGSNPGLKVDAGITYNPSTDLLVVGGDIEVGDDLFLKSDAAVLNFGADSDVSLTHVADTALLLNSSRQLQFGDSGTYIHQSADGVLDLVSDTEIELTATTIDINGAVDASSTITAAGRVIVDDATEATSTTDGSLQTDGGLSVAKSAVIGDDLDLLSDGAILNFGADKDVVLTHVADTGLLLNSTRQLQFGDSGTYIHQSADGVLDLVSDTEIELTATTIDINGAVDASSTITAAGRIIVDDATEATSTTDGSLQTDGGLSVAKSAVIGDDLDLLSNAAVLNIGSAQKFSMTHANANNTVTVSANHRLAFGDAGDYISGNGTDISIVGSNEINLDATTIDINGAVNVSGQLDAVGDVNIGNATSDTLTITARLDADLDPAANGTISLGSTSLRYATGAFLHTNTVHLTASSARIDNLDVYNINSVTQTETTLEIVDKKILAGSGSASAAVDGGGLQIGGGKDGADNVASILYDHSNLALDFNIAGTTEVRLENGKFLPNADDDIDLGESGLEFKDLYLDGIAYVDQLGTNSDKVASAFVTALTASGVQAVDAKVTGEMSASLFVGNGSGLTNVGATCTEADATSNRSFFLPFVSGASAASALHFDREFKYNPTSGILAITGGLSAGGAATLASAAGVTTIGSATAATFSAAGILNVNNTTDATSTTDGAMQTDGGLSVAKDAVLGNDVKLKSDAAVLSFGADDDVSLTHVADTGILLNSTMQLQFNDASQYINAPSATVLDINATDEIELNATLVDVNANLDVSGTYTGGGLMTVGGNIIIPDGGNIGSASDTNAIAIASGGAVTVSATDSASSTSSGALIVGGGVGIGEKLFVGNDASIAGATTITNSTESTSTGTGALIVYGGVGIGGDANFADDVSLKSDAAVLNFGQDSDVSLTHVADTALLLNSSRQLQFGDSGTYIHQSADGVLDLVSDTEIEINATTIDINGNVEMDSGLTVAGASVTFSALADLTKDTVASGDKFIIQDADASGVAKEMTMLNLGGYLANTGSSSQGIQADASTGKLSISYVEQVLVSGSAAMSLDMVTASLTGEPLDGSLQVFLNGMLQTKEGTAGTTFDYAYAGSAGSRRVQMLAALDSDDVLVLKYIKK